MRKRRMAVAATGVGLFTAAAVASVALALPAAATPSTYCWAAISGTTSIGSCKGNPSGGSFFQVHQRCPSGDTTSPVTYAAPNQTAYAQTAPCRSGTATNAWVYSW